MFLLTILVVNIVYSVHIRNTSSYALWFFTERIILRLYILLHWASIRCIIYWKIQSTKIPIEKGSNLVILFYGNLYKRHFYIRREKEKICNKINLCNLLSYKYLKNFLIFFAIHEQFREQQYFIETLLELHQWSIRDY